MDKGKQNKVELQNEDRAEIKEASVTKKPKNPSAQSAKKTSEKKSDTSAKKSTDKTSSAKNKTGEKKPAKNPHSVLKAQSEEKTTDSIKENSKPKKKTGPKKTTAKKPIKKEQSESFAEIVEKQSKIQADESVKKIDATEKSQEAIIETKEASDEFSASVKEEKSSKAKNTVKASKSTKKKTQKKIQDPADEMPLAQETTDIIEDILSPSETDTTIKQPELNADAKTVEKNEQTITIIDEPDIVGLNFTEKKEAELYEQEVSADQAALIAQSAISQELIIQSDTAVLIPPVADAKSAAESNRQFIKLLLIYGIIILSLIAVYLGFAQYFKTHFYFGAKINNISISGLTLDNAMSKLNIALDNYSLIIKERGNSEEQIKSQDISLSYNSLDDLQGYLDSQNGYGWIGAVFSNNNKTIVASFNADMLKQQINNLTWLKAENITEPQNASFSYVDGSYVIVPEIDGNKIDRDMLYSSVADSVSIMNTKLDLKQTECYIKPQYTLKSEKTVNTQNELNAYITANITYIFGDKEIVIDSSQISSWLSVDKDLNIIFNKNKIGNFINSLEKINKATTYTRDFVTTSGNVVKISGGTYGRHLSTAKETDFIINTIKSGAHEIINFNEIGNTYVEISISKQHIWYYKNGVLIADGSIVTGNVRNRTQTRKGVFYLRTKTRNTTLVGADYEADVSYWMPFDGGIGMHDATWRSYFGGSIYRNNGSHGCVNLPYWLAKKIYNNITVGTPVVVY